MAALGCAEAAEAGADRVPDGGDRAGVIFAEQRLELGEHLLDRVQVGAVGRQERQVAAGAAELESGVPDIPRP